MVASHSLGWVSGYGVGTILFVDGQTSVVSLRRTKHTNLLKCKSFAHVIEMWIMEISGTHPFGVVAIDLIRKSLIAGIFKDHHQTFLADREDVLEEISPKETRSDDSDYL